MAFDRNELSARTWKDDLLSGFLVFLIALPLCLGIASASKFPPVAGILTAIVGGILGTALGSARLTIKGPAAGLIVIVLGAVEELGDPSDPLAGYRRALAVGVVAGFVQIALALARAGALSDSFPPTVVHGMLAAIGVIIVSKQSHVVLGVKPAGKEPLELLAELPVSVAKLNPEIFVIGLVSLAILFGLPKVPLKWVKRVPAPMVVTVVAIGLERLFTLDQEHTYLWNGHAYSVGPAQYLVQLPGRLLDAVTFPDFSRVLSGTSLKYVAMFTLVGSIESLLSAKAIDQLDPQHRQQDLSRDLLATGVANVVAAFIGGLPMISEIVRSSANITNGAKSRLSNLFHGGFLLLFVALFPGLLSEIPLAALGAMLIYTGLRLASPREFVRTFRIGADQLAVFVTTLVVTLATDLLLGVAAGVVLEIALQLKRGAPVSGLFRSHLDSEHDGVARVIRVSRAVMFTNYISLKRKIHELAGDAQDVVIDLAEASPVDHTALEKLHHLSGEWERAGRKLEIRGLDTHEQASPHELASRWKTMSPAAR
jgi:MFS superfamily sulfate permease-like transporter